MKPATHQKRPNKPADLLPSSYFRTGLYPAPSLPYILGREASGTIVATGSGGDLFGLAAGDRVVWMATGAYAEYTAVPTAHATKVPAGVQADVAAAALLQGLTALTLIREAHPVKKGDWVLVHAAAGGVGLWLCQLLRAIGARTIGTASSAEKIDLARKNGAEVLINYSNEDVVAKVKEVTGGAGVVAAFDGVGKATFDISMESLARKGSMVSFGNASGAVPPVTIAYVIPFSHSLMRAIADCCMPLDVSLRRTQGSFAPRCSATLLLARSLTTIPLSFSSSSRSTTSTCASTRCIRWRRLLGHTRIWREGRRPESCF